MLELASYFVEIKSAHFHPEKFEDQYEDALKELLKKKQAGEKIEVPKERASAKVIDLMDALQQSVEAERGGGARRKTERDAAAHHRTPKKAGRSANRSQWLDDNSTVSATAHKGIDASPNSLGRPARRVAL